MTPKTKIRITILDDHQSIIDGYLFRLNNEPQVEVIATVNFGKDLEATLKNHPTDVLLLDVSVPESSENRNPYPILHVIPKLLQAYPELNILVISMHAERSLIRAVMEAGASGYILKDDRTTIEILGSVVKTVASGGIYFSQSVHDVYLKYLAGKSSELLTQRQLEALSLSAAYPDDTTTDLAQKMHITNSTVRNLLSASYTKLEVHNRTAAIAKARQLGIITPHPPEYPK